MSPGSSKRVKISAVGKISKQITWTDASMNRDGNLIAVRGYSQVVFYPRTSSQTVADSLGGTACSFNSRTVARSNQNQYEGVTFMAHPYFAEASECLNKMPCNVEVTRHKLKFNN